jgi:hypothetical protein
MSEVSQPPIDDLAYIADLGLIAPDMLDAIDSGVMASTGTGIDDVAPDLELE